MRGRRRNFLGAIFFLIFFSYRLIVFLNILLKMSSFFKSFILFIFLILPVLAGCKPEKSDSGLSTGHAPVLALPSSAEIPFVDDYSEGLEMARQWDKPILVFFSTSWCPFSRQMLQETFKDPQIVRLAKQFICIQVDIEKNPAQAQTLQVHSVPTVHILSSRGVHLNHLRGQLSSQQLASQMQETLHALASRQDRPRQTLR